MSELKFIVEAINDLARRIRTLESADRPYNVDSRLTTVETDVNSVAIDINAAESDITAIESRLTSTENEIDALQTSPVFVPLTTPLTSASWDGDAKTTANRGTIDLSSVFGVPAGVKAVLARLEHTDATVGAFAALGPSATYAACLVTLTQVASKGISSTSPVPCDANGDIYFYCSEDLDAVKIEIWGYWT